MKKVFASLVIGAMAILSIACATDTVTPSGMVVETEAMVVDIVGKANFDGCINNQVVVNEITYATHDLTVNINMHGFTAIKQVVCDVVDGQEGMWMTAGNVWKFYTNEGTFIR